MDNNTTPKAEISEAIKAAIKVAVEEAIDYCNQYEKIVNSNADTYHGEFKILIRGCIERITMEFQITPAEEKEIKKSERSGRFRIAILQYRTILRKIEPKLGIK